MKSMNLLRIGAAFAATLLMQHNIAAQGVDPWTTVDAHHPFGPEPTESGNGGEIAINPGTGQIYAVGGVGLDQEGDFLGTLRTSPGGGNDWTPLDSYRKEGWTWSVFRGVAADSLGRVFTGGETSSSITHEQAWFVRESVDSGGTWVISDFVHIPGLMGQSCADVKVASPSGDVYASGHTSNGSTRSWTVRKRAATEVNFTTVDSVPGVTASSITFHPAGVFVAGQLATTRTSAGWTVRMSPTGAIGTWKTVDSFNEQGYPAAALGITAAANGWIYAMGWAERVVGKGKTATRVKSWIVRRSVDNGVTWAIVDRFGSWPAGSDARANAAVVDSADGVVFVAGTTPDGAFVRKGTPGANGTISWVNSDDYQGSEPLLGGTRLNGITIDQTTGELFTIGGANDGAGLGGWGHWTTRKLTR